MRAAVAPRRRSSPPRIHAAGDAGVRLLATETVDRVDGIPRPSFRNVLRAGFEEAYVQQWWLPPE